MVAAREDVSHVQPRNAEKMTQGLKAFGGTGAASTVKVMGSLLNMSQSCEDVGFN